MANAENFKIAGNDEHGINPPTAGKRTPIMPYIDRPFYENEFNYPTKNYFLAAAARNNFATFDVKPQLQDISISTRVNRVNNNNNSLVATFAYNATVNTNFNNFGGLEVYYSPQNIYASRSLLLSQNIYEKTSNNGYVKGNEVRKLYDTGMLSSVRVPATLIEAGYMTNFDQAKLMVDPDYQKLIAELTLQGVCVYLSVTYKTVNQTNYPTIRFGSSGTAVSNLQFMLLNYGYRIATDGNFGAATDMALKSFQTQNSLVADGIAGKNTWAKLNNMNPSAVTLRRNSRGVEVRYLQAKLLSKLYPIGNIDGDFGETTEMQVKAFQAENSLVADGVVGKNTWNKIMPIGGGRPMLK